MGAFKKLQGKLEKKEGYSKKVAAAVAAKIGRASIGQKAMTKRSIAGKKK